MKTNKRIISLIIVCLIAILTIAGCGNKELKYIEATSCGLRFELPEKWGIVQDGNDIKATKLDNSTFSVMANTSITSNYFDDFADFYAETLQKQGTTIISRTKTTYSSHEAYDYTGTVIIAGKTSDVKATVVLGQSGAVCFLMGVSDEAYDYNKIYSHMLNSIK